MVATLAVSGSQAICTAFFIQTCFESDSPKGVLPVDHPSRRQKKAAGLSEKETSLKSNKFHNDKG
jgi:hypothetical protein